jgi:ATP-binding cassette subfamily B protein
MNLWSKAARGSDFQPTTFVRLYKRFRGHLAAHRTTLLFAGLCMAGTALMEILQPWPIKIIFDGLLIPQTDPQTLPNRIKDALGNDNLFLAVASLSILVIAAIGGLFAYGQTYLISSVGHKVVASVRLELYSHIQRLSQNFHDASGSGDLLARLTGDVRLMRDVLVSALIRSTTRCLVVFGTLVIMALMDWRLTLVALVIVPLLVLTMAHWGVKIRGAARKQRKKEGNIANVMAESLSAIKVIRAYAREDYEHERFAIENSASTDMELKAARLEGYLNRLVQVILALGTCVVIWYGVLRVRAGALSPGDLIVFSAYLTGLYKPIRRLAAQTARLSKATVSGERILAILDQDPEIKEHQNAVPAPQFKGRIEFDNVRFAYVLGKDVLTAANLRIRPGEKVALFSESGSGKSTIAHLVLRFYDPQSGYVRIDGRDIRQYTLASLREQISILLQDSILFNATVRDNIAYGKLDATEDEIVAAAKAANAQDFITRLPAGYETIVGERGATLSGGERQRIAIARAMIREAPIVILDEPMTGLDAVNEQSVKEALLRLMASRTCILITHDPAMARLADRILTIRNGTLEELDKRELLAIDATLPFEIGDA